MTEQNLKLDWKQIPTHEDDRIADKHGEWHGFKPGSPGGKVRFIIIERHRPIQQFALIEALPEGHARHIANYTSEQGAMDEGDRLWNQQEQARLAKAKAAAKNKAKSSPKEDQQS